MPAATSGLVAACFSPNYASARARFLLASAEAGARIDVMVNTVATAPNGSTLTTDVAVLGPPSAEAALVVFCATHGPEGFVGSAAQIALLRELASRADTPPAVRIVLVHAINPWGFAHISRTTENNVDLNRNFVDWTQPLPENPHYDELHELFCVPQWNPQALERARSGREAWKERHGHSVYMDATSKGQYTHADGLNYGGSDREWSNQALETVIARHLDGVKKIALIDWHTGLGERGQPFFLCFNERGGGAWERACQWWGRENVESSGGFGGAARPNYTGLLFHGVQRFAAGAEVTGAVVEFGTLGNDDMRQALQMDRYLKFGGLLDATQRAVMREQVLDAFVPLSLLWRRSVLGHAMKIQHQALQGVVDWQ